jgi:hypothetical protein
MSEDLEEDMDEGNRIEDDWEDIYDDDETRKGNRIEEDIVMNLLDDRASSFSAYSHFISSFFQRFH